MCEDHSLHKCKHSLKVHLKKTQYRPFTQGLDFGLVHGLQVDNFGTSAVVEYQVL